MSAPRRDDEILPLDSPFRDPSRSTQAPAVDYRFHDGTSVQLPDTFVNNRGHVTIVRCLMDHLDCLGTGVLIFTPSDTIQGACGHRTTFETLPMNGMEFDFGAILPDLEFDDKGKPLPLSGDMRLRLQSFNYTPLRCEALNVPDIHRCKSDAQVVCSACNVKLCRACSRKGRPNQPTKKK